MFDQYIHQLKSADPQQRRQAIISLADSGDPRAPQILGRVAKTDPMPALRAIAEKAEQHAQRKQWRGMDTPAPTSVPSLKPSVRQVEASPLGGTENRERARAQINNAYSYRNNGDKGNGARALTLALEFDPALRDSDEIKELAAELTGEPPNQAIDWLLDKKKQHDGKVKKQAVGESSGTLWTNIAIEAVIILVLGFGTIYLYMNYAVKSPEAMSIYSEAATYSQDAAETLAFMKSIRPTDLMPIALIAGVVLLISSLVITAVMFAAGLVMGGSGSFPNFMDKQLRVTAVGSLVTLVIAVLLFMSLNSSRSAQRSMGSFADSFSKLTSFGVFIASVYYAAKTHEFGYIRGCFTILSPVIAIFACLLVYIFVLAR